MPFDWDEATQEERLTYLRRKIGSMDLELETLQARLDELERDIKRDK